MRPMGLWPNEEFKALECRLTCPGPRAEATLWKDPGFVWKGLICLLYSVGLRGGGLLGFSLGTEAGGSRLPALPWALSFLPFSCFLSSRCQFHAAVDRLRLLHSPSTMLNLIGAIFSSLIHPFFLFFFFSFFSFSSGCHLYTPYLLCSSRWVLFLCSHCSTPEHKHFTDRRSYMCLGTCSPPSPRPSHWTEDACWSPGLGVQGVVGSWLLWDCSNQRFSSWQAPIPRAIHIKQTGRHSPAFLRQRRSLLATPGDLDLGAGFRGGTCQEAAEVSEGMQARKCHPCMLSLCFVTAQHYLPERSLYTVLELLICDCCPGDTSRSPGSGRQQGLCLQSQCLAFQQHESRCRMRSCLWDTDWSYKQ